jgi:hypothetical protein
MKRWMNAILLLSFLVASGCSTLAGSDVGYRDGWRKAKVMRLIGPKEVGELVTVECQAEVSKSVNATRMAVVSYSFGGNPNLRARCVALIAGESKFEVNDIALVNIRDCLLPIKALGV